MAEKTKVYLVTDAKDAKSAESMALPCVFLYYRIGDGGILQRAQLPMSARSGLMGVYEAPGLAAADPERLARDLAAECTRRGFSGVVLDFLPAQDAYPKLEALDAALTRQKLLHFVPQEMTAAAPGAKVIAPSAVSGGSFSQMLDALCQQYGAENLCLDLVRSCNDFSMPAYSPDGTFLSPQQFLALKETYQPSAFFSPELCAKYFTYRKTNGSAHFVIFDDGDSAVQKLRVAAEKGLFAVFLLYSEWGGDAKSIVAGR